MRRRTSLRRWISDLAGTHVTRTGDGRWVIVLALALTSAIAVLRYVDRSPADAPGVLMIVPVALCAVRFGLRGGLISAGLGVGLATMLNLTASNQFSWIGYGTRATAVFVVGGLVGSFVERSRKLEGELAPHKNLSLDLIATADFEGVFTSVNGAWEQTLG
jgi:hypothetical protein